MQEKDNLRPNEQSQDGFGLHENHQQRQVTRDFRGMLAAFTCQVANFN